MTSVAKTPADWDTSGIEDRKPRVASSVTVPLADAETDLGDARERVSVSANDTHFKHLYDAIALKAGSGLIKQINNAGGDEALLLDLPVTDMTLLDDAVLASAASSISITSISSTYDDWYLVAWLRGDTAATTVQATVQLANDATAANYYHQRIRAFGSTVDSAEGVGTVANLLQGSVVVPAANSPSGAWGLLVMRLIGVNSSTYGVTAQWEVATPSAESSGNIRWFAGTGWYNQLSVVSRLDIIPASGNWATNSRYRLYGLKD